MNIVLVVLLESVAVGVAFTVITYLLALTVKSMHDVNLDDGPAMFALITFLSGAFLHILCEVTGINRKFCTYR